MLFVVWGIVAKWGSRWAHNPKVRGSKPRYAFLFSQYKKSNPTRIRTRAFCATNRRTTTIPSSYWHQGKQINAVLHRSALPVPPVIEASHFNIFIITKNNLEAESLDLSTFRLQSECSTNCAILPSTVVIV